MHVSPIILYELPKYERRNMSDENKTLYSITDEHGEKSTITIDKWAADLLQGSLPDVHAWIQEKYVRICEKKPELSRREKGDLLRMLAYREAQLSPLYDSLIDIL
jgi:hypothetical protein